MHLRTPLACILCVLMFVASLVQAADTVIKSPDGKWVATLSGGKRVVLRVSKASGPAFLEQEIGLQLADGKALEGGEPTGVKTRTVNEKVRPVAPTKFAEIADHFNEAALAFPGGFSLEVRAYDNGVAYRFMTNLPGDIVVNAEKQVNRFHGDPIVRLGAEKGFYSHNELAFGRDQLSRLSGGALTSLPTWVASADEGPRMVFCETALESYPGQWLRVGKDGKSLEAVWPAYPIKEEEKGDRDILVKERAPELARTKGTRSFPWRYVALGETDGDILLNQLGYLLAEPSRVQDTSWIKPGKAQWDWWHEFNVWDTDFQGGVSQTLYKHYIDFASANGAQYIIWTKAGMSLAT